MEKMRVSLNIFLPFASMEKYPEKKNMTYFERKGWVYYEKLLFTSLEVWRLNTEGLFHGKSSGTIFPELKGSTFNDGIKLHDSKNSVKLCMHPSRVI